MLCPTGASTIIGRRGDCQGQSLLGWEAGRQDDDTFTGLQEYPGLWNLKVVVLTRESTSLQVSL